MEPPDSTAANETVLRETVSVRSSPESLAVEDAALEASTVDADLPATPALPTMNDLDRLAADLDQVDHTLAALDGAPAA